MVFCFPCDDVENGPTEKNGSSDLTAVSRYRQINRERPTREKFENYHIGISVVE